MTQGDAPPILDAYAILRVLAEHDVDFVVIGGFAVAFHGYIRATKDLDVVPDPALEPQTEQKVYAPGVGVVSEHVVRGHHERFVLVSVTR